MQITDALVQSRTPAAATSPAASASPSIDYNSFLKLLVAQMQNQDPTNPTDSTQWVSQLATFSSVEQAIQANAKLDEIMLNGAIAEAGALVGKTVTSADGTQSGLVVSVTYGAQGAIANLADGSSLALGAGVTIG